MEGTFLKEMPKFKSPEEELTYLRAHIEKREQELKATGHFEHTGDVVTKEVLSKYKEVPITEVIHKNIVLGKKETEGIVLKLKPEAHDTIMEELLGLVITKGIKNAANTIRINCLGDLIKLPCSSLITFPLKQI